MSSREAITIRIENREGEKSSTIVKLNNILIFLILLLLLFKLPTRHILIIEPRNNSLDSAELHCHNKCTLLIYFLNKIQWII